MPDLKAVVAWRRLKRYPTTLLGFGIVGLFLLTAVIGPLVAPYGYADQTLSERLQPPSATHWFGTDRFGRDVFSRVLVGSRDVITAAVARPIRRASGLAERLETA